MLVLTKTERNAIVGVIALTAVAGILRYVGGVSEVIAFIIAGCALAGQAWIVSFATEQVGHRIGASATGFLHSTLGNLPEFFVVIFALQAGQKVVAETAILGSILVNALLVLGLVIIAGARRTDDGLMRFQKKLPMDTATLLLVAAFIIVLVGLAGSSHDTASHHINAISMIAAIAILIVYAVWAIHYVGRDTPVERAALTPARLNLQTSLLLLTAAATASAFTSDWFVHALEPTSHQLHISQAFAGLVIVAIAGNAVENVAGIALAARGRSDLAISVVKNSIAQIAAFLYPLLVVVSVLTKTRLTFAIAPVYIGALFGTALLLWQITGDGEATAFEGTALVAAFVLLATVAAYE